MATTEDTVDVIITKDVARALLTLEPLSEEHTQALRDAAALAIGATDTRDRTAPLEPQ